MTQHSRRPADGRSAGTVLALTAFVLIAVGLMALTAMVLPYFFWMIAVIFGFVLLGILQYMVWGRWLSRNDGQDDES